MEESNKVIFPSDGTPTVYVNYLNRFISVNGLIKYLVQINNFLGHVYNEFTINMNSVIPIFLKTIK